MSERTGARQRSQIVFPAGSNGEFNLPFELSIVIDRGHGCRLWDSEGHEYLDFSMGWGSVLVGHANAAVVTAVTERAGRGSNFSYVTEDSLLLAEEILRISPASDQIRFCASGTEATMYCQRMARAYTGRSKILKFEGAYHGANEIGVTSLFPAAPPAFPVPDTTSVGSEQLVRDSVLVAPFNDLETTTSIIRQNADQIAAVIVEPLQRCLPPRPGFLEGLRSETRQHNLLLIFDEVVTGFRLAYGGAQEYYGVVPDLVAYGKALGGGYPIGAYGGQRDIMNLVREERLGERHYVWSASTLGGNPVSAAASLAALNELSGDRVYDKLHYLGKYLREGLRRLISDKGLTAQVVGDGPLAQVAFTDETIMDYRSSQLGDKARARALMLELFSRRVFLNPMGTKLYLSAAHSEDVCRELLDRCSEALAKSSRY